MDKNRVIRKDDLLYCQVCGKPIEKIIKFPAFDGTKDKIDKKVSIMCECKMAERKKFEKRQKEQQDIRIAESLKKLSLMDEKLLKANLTSFVLTNENEKLFKIIKNYIMNFDKMYEKNQGLLLTGPVGTGKSYAAAVIANELLERRISVVMTSFIKILKEVSKFGTDNGKIEKINRAKLLIIDDLGTERSTDYTFERVYDIIDSRYRCNKPVILTTNMTLEQMKDCDDIRYNRIYDRIFEMCYPVKVTGLSWRKKEAASRYSETKKILEG